MGLGEFWGENRVGVRVRVRVRIRVRIRALGRRWL